MLGKTTVFSLKQSNNLAITQASKSTEY